MNAIPDYATHYYPADNRPFQNLSELSDSSRNALIEELALRRSSEPGYRRVFGPKYMDMRLKTEAKMRDLFCRVGGQPERQAPHYFVLGTSPWFENLYAETKSVTLPLDALPHERTSVTYPDSFAAMRLGEEFGLPPEPEHPAHNRVFRLDDLPGLIHDYGLPVDESTDDYENYHRRAFKKYIEIQLWCDTPVKEHLS